MLEIFERARAEIVDAQHIVALLEKGIGQMRTKETCSTRDHHAHGLYILTLGILPIKLSQLHPLENTPLAELIIHMRFDARTNRRQQPES
jgi:hypothetical protein